MNDQLHQQHDPRPGYVVPHDIHDHPLFLPLVQAIEQALYGKGQRHGGGRTPFLEQPIFHYARMHGRGFLTGQATKKLEEAASTRNGDAFITELLGALVYTGAAIVFERQKMERSQLTGDGRSAAVGDLKAEKLAGEDACKIGVITGIGRRFERID